MRPVNAGVAAGMLAAGLLTTASARADLLTYENARFGTRLTFPAELFDTRMDPPANGDGMTWTSADGASLAVYAGNNALMVDEAQLLIDIRASEPGVTYAAKGDGWVVVSGMEDGVVFYQRFEFGDDDVIHSMLLRYPHEKKAEFDPLIKPIADSLDGP